jgi:hypothetical protein
VGVWLGAGVGVALAAGVGVSIAVAVADGIRVFVAVGVAVADEIGVFVAVAVLVSDRTGVFEAVGVGVTGRVALGVGVGVAVGSGPALTQSALPTSVKVCPPTGMNSQSKLVGWRVNLSTPQVVLLRTSLLGWIVGKEYKLAPPVPTTSSRIPRVGSPCPVGSCGANRS